MFKVLASYTKKDIYRIMKVPTSQQGGSWNTGYNRFNNDFFLFCNVGIPGRTGHHYNNNWDGNNLIWFGKNGTNISQISIKELISNDHNVYIFTRVDSRMPFTYQGLGFANEYENSIPVKIIWSFKNSFDRPEILPEEISAESRNLWEGSSQKILVNKYERNPEARKQCIDHYGHSCQICKFDFEKSYGNIGKDFIHVHHIIPISEIKKNYIINPINDLIPVCPNCHAIIHKRNPCLTIEEVKTRIVKITTIKN